MNQEAVKGLCMPQGGFGIIFDRCGEIADVVNEKGESVEPKAFPLETEKIERVIGDLTLMYVHSSPGHWVIINGRRRWCP